MKYSPFARIFSFYIALPRRPRGRKSDECKMQNAKGKSNNEGIEAMAKGRTVILQFAF
jgi:hypothetical protein